MKDKKLELFEGKDFITFKCYHGTTDFYDRENLARFANKILAKKLADCPRVYGTRYPKQKGQITWDGLEYTTATHTALLFDVQKIETECAHEALTLKDHYFFCGKCDKRLKPTGWEVI